MENRADSGQADYAIQGPDPWLDDVTGCLVAS